MLITFKSRDSADVTMFGDVALKLIKLMGRRDTVPSAMEPGDIQSALNKLRAGIAVEDVPATEEVDKHDEDDAENRVSLRNRALPLIDLLEAAQAKQVPVMWDQETRRY
ncbi:MAG: DUF1840 domain-containing protein [Woeseiaceae bacterium]|nr:DUF1840 domain-containing protein [Woeseiaceae bacterium]